MELGIEAFLPACAWRAKMVLLSKQDKRTPGHPLAALNTKAQSPSAAVYDIHEAGSLILMTQPWAKGQRLDLCICSPCTHTSSLVRSLPLASHNVPHASALITAHQKCTSPEFPPLILFRINYVWCVPHTDLVCALCRYLVLCLARKPPTMHN